MSIYDYQICSDSEIICPYCHHRKQYSGDSLGNNEETEEICSECDKKFRVVAIVSKDHQCYPMEEE